MSSKHLRYLCFLLLEILTVLAAVPQALSQTGGSYDLTWNTTDGGGITFANGGAYNLGSTIGQHDAGASTGGAYSLTGGFWGIANQSQPTPPTPSAVVSRKLHGGTPYDINLPLTGNAGIECRSGGASNVHQVIVTFPTAVTFTSAAVTSGSGSVSGSSGSGTATATIDLTSVSNAQRIEITLFNVNNSGNIVVPMEILLGDVNSSRIVTGSDVNVAKAQQSKPLTNGNFRSDINASGVISGSDINLIKAKASTHL